MSYEAARRSNDFTPYPDGPLIVKRSHGIWFIVRVSTMSLIGGGIGGPYYGQTEARHSVIE